MTTPRDDIAGLSERLNKRARASVNYTGDNLCGEAATQLDALQARVKELGQQLAAARKSLDQQTQMASEQFCRALRAEQERDEAYERAAKAIDVEFDRQRIREDAAHGFSYDRRQPANREVSDALRKAADLVRSLAACPEKEKKE